MTDTRTKFEAFIAEYASKGTFDLTPCPEFPKQYEDLETQMLYDAFESGMAVAAAPPQTDWRAVITKAAAKVLVEDAVALLAEFKPIDYIKTQEALDAYVNEQIAMRREEIVTGPVVVPAGWKLVPIEPTEKMIIDGFESVPSPNPSWTPMDVWDEYEEMSGCEQAAFRAKLCWAAMLAAAPEPTE